MQVETQPKPLAPIAITFRQDAEYLHAANDVLHHEPLTRELPIVCLLLVGQRMQLAFLVGQTAVLVGQTAVLMALFQAQIAAVR